MTLSSRQFLDTRTGGMTQTEGLNEVVNPRRSYCVDVGDGAEVFAQGGVREKGRSLWLNTNLRQQVKIAWVRE